MTFQAASENDDQAPMSESSISIQLEASNTAGGLGAVSKRLTRTPWSCTAASVLLFSLV